MNKMCNIVEDEIDKIAEKGLTSSNIDNAYKLTKMRYYLKTSDAMDDYEGGNSYDMDHSMRNHWVRGHMSRSNGMDGYSGNDSYDRYSQAKYDYRHSRSDSSRRDVMSNLDEYMDGMTQRLKSMMNDADTPEERETIRRYLNNIKA